MAMGKDIALGGLMLLAGLATSPVHAQSLLFPDLATAVEKPASASATAADPGRPVAEAQNKPADNKTSPAGEKTQTADHTVNYEGVPNGLAPKFKLVASLDDKDRVFPTTISLRRAANSDATEFRRLLTAAGYYASTVDFRIDNRGDKPKVTFSVDPGPLFSISEHRIAYQQRRETGRPTTFADLKLAPTNTADGASLKANQDSFLSGLWNAGYPGASITGRRAEAQISTGTATAIYTFNSGPRAFFGEPDISGLDRVKESFVRKLTNWEPGTVYQKSKILDYRDRLSETNLFSAIDVQPGTTAPDGETPVLVSVEERKHRTIGAGVTFSTSEGPGVRVFFENRNVFRNAERARVDIEVSQIEQSIGGILEKPLVTLPGTAFVTGQFANQTTDAFDARTFEINGGVSKFWLDRRLETRGGIGFEATRVIPADEAPRETNTFFKLPLSAIWDNEDSFLNPTKGVRASLTVEPNIGTQTFTRIEANVRTRFTFGAEDSFITAFRGRVGATMGIDLATLPRNRRFFSGGGGSIRGWGFQLAGPIEEVVNPNFDPENDNPDGEFNIVPIGGRSVAESGFEARYEAFENIQIAAFIDAGTVFDTTLPDFSERFFFGVGGGIRYLSPIGPLRVDLAFPMNKRPSDSPVQFLISLGQAF